MLGIFGRIPSFESVKTRLQARLERSQVESFYRACVADTLETCLRVTDTVVLFISGPPLPRATVEAEIMTCGLDSREVTRLQVEFQRGDDLGERMENAFEVMCKDGGITTGAILVGSDSPTMPEAEIRRGLSMLESTDLVLGPAADGGYWAIGVRQPIPGLLRDISWSTDRTLAETEARARSVGLRVAHLASWTDVDRPEDLPVLARQIAALRAGGDLRTARHSEAALRALGLVEDDLRWRG